MEALRATNTGMSWAPTSEALTRAAGLARLAYLECVCGA
jgi:hypothetical protein